MTTPHACHITMTPTAAELLHSLYTANEPLMFHQSSGYCDSSSPMCYLAGEFRTDASDVLLAALRIEKMPEPISF